MRKTLIIGLLISSVLFILYGFGLYRSSQPPYNYTGADVSTCAQCHGNLNSGGGTISAPGLPVAGYMKGQAYDFNILISHPVLSGRWGFAITARDANNAAVGTFTTTNPNAALMIDELSHLNAVFQSGTSFSYNNLRWTAPANPTVAQQTVKFYFIGNAANGDGGTGGDFIYSGTANSIMVTPPNQPPVVSITSPANNVIIPAGAPVTLTANASDPDGSIVKVEFYDHGGKFLTDNTAPYEYTSINEVEPGIYLLTAKAFDNKGDSTLSDTVHLTVTGCTPQGSVTAEGYVNIPGTQVADLLNHPSYPSSPGIITNLPTLEYNNVGDNYGARLRGYICAPTTGNYTFYIAGDDQAGLFLSTDANPANKVLVAYNLTPVAFREWTRFPTQRSVPIKLVKGARYYFETLHKQSTGQNHLSVRWVMPNGVSEAPISATRLSPYTEPGLLTMNRKKQQEFRFFTESAALGLTVEAMPNPSTTYFLIKSKSNDETRILIRVFDVTGKLMQTTTSKPGTSMMLGNNLKPGIYFLEATQGTANQRMKLVKQ
jgi:hypothetical protein